MLEDVRRRGVQIGMLTLHIGYGTFRPVRTEDLDRHTMLPEYYELPLETSRLINRTKLAGSRIVAVGTTVCRVLETKAAEYEAYHERRRKRQAASARARRRRPDQDAASAEALGQPSRVLRSGKGMTRLFIYPPYTFRCVDGLLTNFHLPRTTLLMLVCAFAGKDLIMRAYEEAVRERYRFYSYGDAMLIV
jgi:S-adenosylmethionine:tRNA ribosyltransferase-isomerase